MTDVNGHAYLKSNRQISPRDILAGTATGLAVLPSGILGFQGIPPSEKLNIAFIGIGTYGARGLRELAPTQNIVAVCDVDRRARK